MVLRAGSARQSRAEEGVDAVVYESDTAGFRFAIIGTRCSFARGSDASRRLLHRRTAVDVAYMPGNERRFGRCQECDDFGDLPWLGHASEWSHSDDALKRSRAAKLELAAHIGNDNPIAAVREQRGSRFADARGAPGDNRNFRFFFHARAS